MNDVLAIMMTMTTYGTRLQKSDRRCVEREIILPASPSREVEGEYSGLTFSADELRFVGTLLGTSLEEHLGLPVWGMTVQTWYVHFIVGGREQAGQIVQCAEQAVRLGLKQNRPIWSPDYHKRLCFDGESVHQLIAYVERNNLASGLPGKPWNFVATPTL